MQSVSADFLAEIKHSHTSYSYADVITATGQTTRLTITGGGVTVDRTAANRRRASITAIDPLGLLTPLSSVSPLAPYGSTMKIYRGVKYVSGKLAGTTEVVPLGTFRISTATAAETDTGTPEIAIDAYDLSRTVGRQTFTEPYTITSGTNIVTAIKAIIARAVDDVIYDQFTSTVTTTADQTYDTSDNPWDVVGVLAQAIGCEVYFTALNHVKIAPPIDVDHLPAPVWTFEEGNGCTMLELDVDFTDDPGYNGVVVIGQSTGDATTAPVRSVQWDDNPSSPTYYLGPYGQVPQVVQLNNIATQADADAAAKAQLNLVLGFLNQLSVSSTVNPALDADDVVAVKSAKSGINDSYAIDALTIPLEAGGTMGLTLRQKRTT